MNELKKNDLAAKFKAFEDKGFNDGLNCGQLYYTSLIIIAIHNLYGWGGRAFDKIEAEAKRIDAEIKSERKTSGEQLYRIFTMINRFRPGYFKLSGDADGEKAKV